MMDETPAQLDIADDIARFAEMGVLGRLLMDRSTGRNIIWASNVFVDKGESYAPSDEILLADITGDNAGLIRTRASKAKEAQTALTRAHAEVFTPTWIVKKMVDAADEAWWEAHPDATWQDYVRSPRLEITCGEAPYLVSRYDAADGTPIPVDERVGILDRKLKLVGEHTTAQKTWAKFAHMALQSTYGYEFQGDNLLIARVNILATLEDYGWAAGHEISRTMYERFARTISWNIWQMDGLSDMPPLLAPEVIPEEEEIPKDEMLPGFAELFGDEPKDDVQQPAETQLRLDSARIYDWKGDCELWFSTLKGEGAPMKFDYVIGNPPYQDENAHNGRQPPIYDKFMEASYRIGDVVELITPARFLFNAGQTSKAWNRKMLSDEHLKVVHYEPVAARVFPNTDIKGGVAITLRNATKVVGPINFFSSVSGVNTIVAKAFNNSKQCLDSIVSSQGLYKLTDSFFEAHPQATSYMGGGTGRKIVSRFVESYSEGFSDAPPEANSSDYVGLLIRTSSGRAYRYVKREYIQSNAYLDTYNVLVPKANGSGKFGERLSSPEVSLPGNGSADTFISIGMFNSLDEANSLLTYLQTKFLRALLGAKKVTQDNPKAVWSLIPNQDFTSSSDIDWSQSISEIDQQLYKKYGLTQEEVDFIESHVKEMQ